MKTVNSLSGGKTSSFLAAHYPADFDVFALILIDDYKCSPKDKYLIKKVSDKIGMQFIATAEDDKTLIAMFDLEQLIGRKIIWLTGKSFDSVIDDRKALPSDFKRFCTFEMKIKPIYNWWKNNLYETIKMRVGYRYDEKERMDNFKTTYKDIIGCNIKNRKNEGGEIDWRIGEFPLIENKQSHFNIKQWADNSGIEFPEDSNCVGCFWKPFQQLRMNWDKNPEKMEWFANKERQKYGNRINRTFKKGVTYDQIKTIGLQNEFQFGTGAGCKSGFCTD